MNRPLITVLAVLLIVAVPASAWHLSPGIPNPGPRETVDTRNRVLATQTVNLDNALAGNLLTHTFAWDPEFSFTNIGHTIRVQLYYTATFPSLSDGAWEINVAKEATGTLTSCAVRIETVNPVGISLDAVPIYAHYEWNCLFTASTKAHPHNHTIYVNRTAVMGTPSAMAAESLSVRLETEDVILVDSGINYTLEAVTAFLPLILAVVLLAITARRENPNYWVMGISGLFFLVASVATPWPASVESPWGTIPNLDYVLAIITFVVAFYLILITVMGIQDWNEARRNAGMDSDNHDEEESREN